MWVFPKIRGTFLGAPIIRSIKFWGLYWGPLVLGNYHVFPNKTHESKPTPLRDPDEMQEIAKRRRASLLDRGLGFRV